MKLASFSQTACLFNMSALCLKRLGGLKSWSLSGLAPLSLSAWQYPTKPLQGFKPCSGFSICGPPFGTEHGCGYFLSSDACVEAMIAPFRFSEKSNA
jgi:hypothetical protein